MIKNSKTRSFQKLTVCGMDMGSKNSACGIYTIHFKGDKITKFVFKTTHMLKHLIDDLTGTVLQDQAKAFYKDIVNLVKYHQIDLFVVERFQTRGRRWGSLDEKVSVMNGIVVALCLQKRLKIQLITAATWKNQFHRLFGKDYLKVLYKQNKNLNHLIDANMIALYPFNLYSTLQKKKNLDRLIQKFQANTTPARSRK